VSVEIELRSGSATADDVEAAWREVLAMIVSGESEVATYIESHGGDPAVFAAADVTAENRSGNVGSTILITILTTGTAEVVKSIWHDLVRPRLERKGVEPGPDLD
jgi:hypothetical protein